MDVGARSALVRVTIAVEPRRAADAQLVVLIDGARERRQRALPASAGAAADTGASHVTLGFAVTRRAQLLALEIGGRRLPLPEPVVRSAAAVALAAPAVVTPPAATLAEQLRAAQGRLAQERAERERLQAERDRAREAAARAEAAAHDASARAETLAGAAAPARDGAARPRRSPRRATAAACAMGSAAIVCGILVWPGGDGAGTRGVSDVSAATPAPGVTQAPVVFDPLARRLQIPSAYLALYRQAGARYGLDWTRLAAIGAIESQHGQSAQAGVLSGANRRGASGPAQFLAGTWERFGVDGDGDGHRDPHDPADAIAAMASYLRASGAPQDWRAALRTYNHSDAYAAAVERLAAAYRRAT